MVANSHNLYAKSSLQWDDSNVTSSTNRRVYSLLAGFRIEIDDSDKKYLQILEGQAMKYGHITVKCPRCDSVIEIISGNISTAIFNCPVCMEGEIHHKSSQPVLQPASAYHQNTQKLEQYITAVNNIWTN